MKPCSIAVPQNASHFEACCVHKQHLTASCMQARCNLSQGTYVDRLQAVSRVEPDVTLQVRLFLPREWEWSYHYRFATRHSIGFGPVCGSFCTQQVSGLAPRCVRLRLHTTMYLRKLLA